MHQLLDKPLKEEEKLELSKVANTIRALSMDAIEKANSGHPGLPLGCAEVGAYLFGKALSLYCADPNWLGRDRFILSAGHGSMLLYSCLSLSGYPINMQDIKNFRQWGSKTPGHPEFCIDEGVETTTGPLGQGFAHAVGQALGLNMLKDRFPEQPELFRQKVYALVSDGDIMEGITSEACSFAGHLKLNNLIVFYDANDICLDGPLNECCSENTAMRYQSYGWEVKTIDGHDLDALHGACQAAQDAQGPVLIICKTTIGKGSPNKQGSSQSHGSPLGAEEVRLTKEALSLSQENFYVPQSVYDFFSKKKESDKKNYDEWQVRWKAFGSAYPESFSRLDTMLKKSLPENLEAILQEIPNQNKEALRSVSHAVLATLSDHLPQLIGGSADLSCSDKSSIKGGGVVSYHDFRGKNIKFGIREFAMAGMCAGIAQLGVFTPFCATFLVFSDYMRNAIRLSALMNLKVIYPLTHDSVFLGEDGPTHQPIEHLASLRAIPNLMVFRPGDANEVKMSWLAALKFDGPALLALSRQSLPLLDGTHISLEEGVGKGAYIIKKESGQDLDISLMATGSELSLAVDTAKALEKMGKSVRVISFPCWELFEKQKEEEKQAILGTPRLFRVSLEAASTMGWHKYLGHNGLAIGIDSFGYSAPAGVIANKLGFEVDALVAQILSH